MKKKMKLTSLEEVTDKYIGKIGTPERDAFEYELRVDLIAEAIKEVRKKRKLTQEQLGKLVGVQKAQISKLESGQGDVRFETVLRVFSALKAKISFNIELLNGKILRV
jgi:DNA-binding XRE family transcriptional regulator